MTTEIQDYLAKPYQWCIIPESDGTFFAQVIEFPGCIATGNTMEEALSNLQGVTASWLEATIAQGQNVPEPIRTEFV